MAQQSVQRKAPSSKDYIKNVAIAGAAGSVGKYITESLIKNGKHDITVLIRVDSKSTFPNGVHIATINYDEPSTIVEALEGQDALIICLPVTVSPDTQRKLIEAAAQAGVSWVMPNAWGLDYLAYPQMAADMMAGNTATEWQQVEQTGVSSWTALVCGFWYEWSLVGSPDRFGFDLKEKSVVFYDDGETKINTSTWAQCGRAVAAFLAQKVQSDDENDSPTMSLWKNKPLHVSSFLVSQKDMFESLLRITGTQRSDWNITYQPAHERWEQGMDQVRKGNYAAFGLLYGRVFFKEDGCGNFEKDGVLANEALNLPRENLDECTRTAIEMAEGGTRLSYF